MKTQCPHCKAGFNVSDTYSGKNAKCPKCKQGFTVHPYSTDKPPQPTPEIPSLPDDAIPEESPKLTAADYDRKISLQRKREKLQKSKRRFSFITDFFLFRIMVFPWLIIIFFAIAFVFTLMYPLFDLLSDTFGTTPKNNPEMLFGTPPSMFALFDHPWLMAWIGLLWLRIMSEWLILFFSMQQDLRSICDQVKATNDNEVKQKISA